MPTGRSPKASISMAITTERRLSVFPMASAKLTRTSTASRWTSRIRPAAHLQRGGFFHCLVSHIDSELVCLHLHLKLALCISVISLHAMTDP